MDKPVFAGEQFDERAERHQPDYLALVSGSDLHFARHRLDLGERRLGGLSVRGPDNHRAVVRHVYRHAELFDHAPDHLAARADDRADLVRRDLRRDHPRGELVHLGARRRDCLLHVIEYRVPGVPGLGQGVAHQFPGDAFDLDVHLERGDAIARPGDLEVHIAGVVLGALDVRQDRPLAVLTRNKAHSDPRHGRLDRDTGVHQAQGRAADARHRAAAV